MRVTSTSSAQTAGCGHRELSVTEKSAIPTITDKKAATL